MPTAAVIAANHALPRTAREAIDDARRRDFRGHVAHVIAAVAYLGSLGFATAPASATFGVLLGFSIIRLPHTWRAYRFIMRDSVGWLMLAWAGWHAVTLMWSPDPGHGLDELKSFRALATPFMLWPVIDHVAWMIGAFLCGVFLQNLAQLGQGLHLIARHAGDGPRLRGMGHPVNTGTLCLIAMCWHFSAFTRVRGWLRWASLAGLAVSGLGLVATGSRGPWIAAAITLPVAAITMLLRRPSVRKPIFLLALAMIPCALAAWPSVRHIIVYRLERTQTDVQRVEAGQYGMDVGYRLACWQAAWEMFLKRPVGGAGAGGFHFAALETSQAKTLAVSSHAHSLYLHVLGCTGAVGAGILMGVMIASLRRTWRTAPDYPYADGVFFALLGWLIAATFDASHLNGQMFGMFAVFITVTLPMRPALRSGAFESTSAIKAPQ